MDAANHLIFIAGLLLLMSIFMGTATHRMGIPVLLILLATGMLFGQDGIGGIVFDNAQLTYTICSFALALILFDSGMRSKKRFFKAVWWPASTLATLGVVLTAAIVALGSWLLLDIAPLTAALIGAIVGSTDAAAVMLLLSQKEVHISRKLSATLEAESGLNDPMAVLLTLAVSYMMLNHATATPLSLLMMLLQQAGIGVAVGLLGGRMLKRLMAYLNLPAGLSPILVMAAALFIFASSNILGGSGFLAAYLSGMIFGNCNHKFKTQIQQFMDGISWLAQMSMMLVLGLLITPTELPDEILSSLVIAVLLIFVARPLAVWMSLLPFHFTLREVAFVAWVGLRGGIPIYLAIIPILLGIDSKNAYFNMAFVVVIISLLLQGSTINFVADKLKLTQRKKSS